MTTKKQWMAYVKKPCKIVRLYAEERKHPELGELTTCKIHSQWMEYIFSPDIKDSWPLPPCASAPEEATSN